MNLSYDFLCGFLVQRRGHHCSNRNQRDAVSENVKGGERVWQNDVRGVVLQTFSLRGFVCKHIPEGVFFLRDPASTNSRLRYPAITNNDFFMHGVPPLPLVRYPMPTIHVDPPVALARLMQKKRSWLGSASCSGGISAEKEEEQVLKKCILYFSSFTNSNVNAYFSKPKHVLPIHFKKKKKELLDLPIALAGLVQKKKKKGAGFMQRVKKKYFLY